MANFANFFDYSKKNDLSLWGRYPTNTDSLFLSLHSQNLKKKNFNISRYMEHCFFFTHQTLCIEYVDYELLIDKSSYVETTLKARDGSMLLNGHLILDRTLCSLHWLLNLKTNNNCIRK